MKVVKHSFDGVIVGAGGAGLRAAIEAAPHMKLAVIQNFIQQDLIQELLKVV